MDYHGIEWERSHYWAECAKCGEDFRYEEDEEYCPGCEEKIAEEIERDEAEDELAEALEIADQIAYEREREEWFYKVFGSPAIDPREYERMYKL